MTYTVLLEASDDDIASYKKRVDLIAELAGLPTMYQCFAGETASFPQVPPAVPTWLRPIWHSHLWLWHGVCYHIDKHGPFHPVRRFLSAAQTLYNRYASCRWMWACSASVLTCM